MCGACTGAAVPTGDAHELVTLSRLVVDVVSRVAPQITGLPAEPEWSELVASTSSAVYQAALVDPDVQRLPGHEQRIVLAARVGLALAFPAR